MNKVIKKAQNIYKNQGPATLVKKGSRFGLYHVRRIFFGNLQSKRYKTIWEEYNYLSNPLFQITQGDIDSSNKAISQELKGGIKTANWFVPNFDHIKFGGVFTIFRFIEKFSVEGVTSRIIIYDNPSFDTATLARQIEENFPNLKNYEIVIYDLNN